MTKRIDTKKENLWNVSDIYFSIEEWQIELDNITLKKKEPYWPEIEQYRSNLKSSLRDAIETIFNLQRKIEKLYTYSHLRHDEDIANNKYKEAHNKSLFLYTTFNQSIAWFKPELLSLDESCYKELLNDKSMKEYRFYLEKMYRLKKHTLSPEKELLMAMSANATSGAQKAFSALNDADFKFGSIENGAGEKLPLTHASYSQCLRSEDRTLRKNAFVKLHKKYEKYENTMAELLQGQVHSHIFNSKSHHYHSSLDAALYPKNINTTVYRNLIKTVESRLSSLHKYIDLRKELLNLKEIHLYDMYAPVTKNCEIKFSYEEACQNVIDSVAPLGKEYQEKIRQGLIKNGWVDRYENDNKRSGAYSSGCHDTMPYILLNFKGSLNDVSTLAHEAGHSMHSLLSRKNQPYQYSDYVIFVAEVASTFNEDLLFHNLFNNSNDKDEKIHLINQKLENIRATLFRQTMFASFELWIHEEVERGASLTPAKLKAYYHELNQKYFGPSTTIDQEIDIEWARIPHFYYNFYVYQYATGISAALALSEKVRNGDESDQKAYLDFLKGGSSKHPLDLLKGAGVDMNSSQSINSTIDSFETLTKTLYEITRT